MHLTATNLTHYLLGRGLVDTATVVAGGYSVVEASRRNRNFKVITRTGKGLFVKQIQRVDQQSLHTMNREASFYRLVNADPAFSAVRSLMPPFRDFDTARYALSLDLLPDTESLAEHQILKGLYPRELGEAAGRAIGTVHAAVSLLKPDTLGATFPLQTPWVFDLHAQPQLLDQFGEVGKQLRQGLAYVPRLTEALGALRPGWTYDSLIHGDLKWENFVLRPSTGDGVHIVDWELVDVGDGAWDIGTIFKEYTVAAIFSVAPGTDSVAFRPTGPVTPDTIRPSVQAFWSAYKTARGWTGPQPDFLQRSVRMAAARMVVAVLEYLHGMKQLSPTAIAMLQTSWNILGSPAQYLDAFLGLAA